MKPLLSICIPTYNRAHYLRCCLQAVLPQVADSNGRVEVCISDNCSGDDTPRLIEEARAWGPFTYSRNDRNRGLGYNGKKLVHSMATGEYVWFLGDHITMLPRALERVVWSVNENQNVVAFFANSAWSTKELWNYDTCAGYRGPIVGLSKLNTISGPVARWQENICGASAIGTQWHAYIVRTEHSRAFDRAQAATREYSSLHTTFGNAVMCADTLMNAPSYYIGEPVVVIRSHTSTWTTAHAIRVMTEFYPQLLAHYKKRGMDESRIRECAPLVFEHLLPHLVEILRGEPTSAVRQIVRYLLVSGQFPEAWRALLKATRIARRPEWVAWCGDQIKTIRSGIPGGDFLRLWPKQAEEPPL